jgi:hypothetical protein
MPSTVKLGSKGPDVTLLQQKLNLLGAKIGVDGDFGPKTHDAVIGFQKAHGLAVDGIVGPNTWAALDAAVAALDPANPPTAPTQPPPRGYLVPLTAAQRLARAQYLVAQLTIDKLDPGIRKDGAPSICPDGYYLLEEHNGGKDPTAPDPFDRWSKPGETFVNRTADCIGGAAWIGGFDRYQPVRFSHLYSGWINTNSMIQDAAGPAKCFRSLPFPEPGCFVVCASGSPGHTVGHIGTIVSVPANWSASSKDAWKALGVVDVASRSPNKANAMTTGAGWFGTGALFVVSKMS